MPSGEAATVWRRLPTRLRDVITIMLGAMVVTGTLAPWLGIAQAWWMTGEPDIMPLPGEDVSWLLVLGEVLQYWPVPNSAVSTTAAAAAALALIMVGGPWSARDVPLSRRRATVLAALVAVVVAVLAPLLRIFLLLYAVTSTPEGLSGLYLADRGGLTDVHSLLGLSAEVLAWSVLLLLGVAWWPRGDAALADDELVEQDTPAEVASVEEPRPSSGPDQGPRERVDPARLRPDGSSDSGFDEFHFRR